MTQGAECGETRVTIFRRCAPDVRFRDLLRNQRRWPLGEWLRRSGTFALHVTCGDRTLANGEERSTCETLEKKEMAGLRSNRDARAFSPWKEKRRRRNVVIPQIVVNGLKGPHDFAGGGA